MPSAKTKMIQLRNVPDALHRSLKARAAMAGMSLSDYLLTEIREIAEQLEMDDESKYVFVLICESAIYRDTAPYLKRVRYGQYLINIGNWTWFIYGVGVVFWILGYLYKRKMI